ncbi:MAG: hypothetical protein WDN24_11645 [Sphingomonas sp.]
MQFLYGSGEGAALSIQAYQTLWTYLVARAKDRKAGLDVRGVVLAPDGTLEAPRFIPCGKRPSRRGVRRRRDRAAQPRLRGRRGAARHRL